MSLLRHFLLTTTGLLFALAPSVQATVTVQLKTSVGDMTFDLDDAAKPNTVANFLHYIRDGLYDHSFAHRLPKGFVLQGGSYYSVNNGIYNISTFAPVNHESGPFPAYSNLKGTLAMALSGSGNDSATSGWFINLKNNDGTSVDNLDTLNGGFTVFGKITAGQSVVDRFAAFQDYNNVDGGDLIFNTDPNNPQAFYENPFFTLPLKFVVNGTALYENLIYTTWEIVGGTHPVITSPSAAYAASAASFSYQIGAKGTAPLTYSVTGGTLPAGLSLNASTGLISGTLTATTPASLSFTVNATNSDGTGSASFSLGINYPIMADGVTVAGTLGKPFQYQVAATNSPTGYAASGLPDGLSINPTTGLISGTPTAAGGPTYVSVSAGNIAATYNATLIISIGLPPAPGFTVSPKIKIKDGVLTLKGAAAAEAVKLEVKVGKSAFKKVKGRLAHWTFPVRILKPGNYKFQVRATDTYGQTSTRTFTLRIGG